MSMDKNRKTLFTMLGLSIAMVGLAYASVPLYDLFCRITGYGGTTQVADRTPDQIIERTIKVRFAANVNRDMPWEFHPVQKEQSVRVGQQALAFYEAENLTEAPITGTATFNVSPFKAGQYFTKIDCFCFTEQTLSPGERVDMPVTYFIDPEIANDRNLDDVKEIVLSYTFFKTEAAGEKVALNDDVAAKPIRE